MEQIVIGKMLGNVMFASWSERQAFARLLFPVIEKDPDGECPARPGLFQLQGDTQWQKPHRVTSCLASKAIALRSERPIFSDAPAGSVLAASLTGPDENRLILRLLQHMHGCIRGQAPLSKLCKLVYAADLAHAKIIGNV